MHSIPGRRAIMALFLIFLMLPIYWLVNMSFKTNGEIVSTMTLWPHQPTLENYMRIFTDESWYSGYIHSLNYVVINTVISIMVALPAGSYCVLPGGVRHYAMAKGPTVVQVSGNGPFAMKTDNM